MPAQHEPGVERARARRRPRSGRTRSARAGRAGRSPPRRPRRSGRRGTSSCCGRRGRPRARAAAGGTARRTCCRPPAAPRACAPARRSRRCRGPAAAGWSASRSRRASSSGVMIVAKPVGAGVVGVAGDQAPRLEDALEQPEGAAVEVGRGGDLVAGPQRRRGRPSSPPGPRRTPAPARPLRGPRGRSPGRCGSGCRSASTRSPCARPGPPGCRSRWRRSARRSPRWPGRRPGRRGWPGWRSRGGRDGSAHGRTLARTRSAGARSSEPVSRDRRTTRTRADRSRRREGLARRDSVPVLDQVDPGDDVDDASPSDRQDARVAGQEQAVGLVEVDRDVHLRQRPGHDVADADACAGRRSSCRSRASVTSWMLPTDRPSRSTGSCEIPAACISSTASATVVSGRDRHQRPRARGSGAGRRRSAAAGRRQPSCCSASQRSSKNLLR